jgi:hypothetical protein
MMKKVWLIAGVMAISTLVGCSSDHVNKQQNAKKEIPVTVDSQKTIQKEITALKGTLADVPVGNIKGATRGSVSIETELRAKIPMTALMATDIVSYEGKSVLAQYMVTNQKSDTLKKRYPKEIKGKGITYLTDQAENSLSWEKDGWAFELIPSQKVPVETLVSWADTFSKDKKLVGQVSKWFSLDDVTFIKDIPGKNVKFHIGISIKNPEQKIVNVPNRMYAIIQTDIKNISAYQINHAVFQKEYFDYSLLKDFKEIKAGDKKAWYNDKTKELYWQDGKFVYHMQDNALHVKGDYFNLEDYKRFASLK